MRACRVCGVLKPLQHFGVGRHEHVCTGCAISESLRWRDAGRRMSLFYGNTTKARK